MSKRIWPRPEDNWANTMTDTDEALRAVEIEMLLEKKKLVSARLDHSGSGVGCEDAR